MYLFIFKSSNEFNQANVSFLNEFQINDNIKVSKDSVDFQ